MPFWLARERCGQDSDWIQRFDPRFWTVNFPRPMMASVVTTGPDSLRVDCEFHHAGELAGLIWSSEDRHDHPLAAYATDRDYSRTTLRFRWRSSGVIPLDAVHGPTLTIEGRDASGAPRAWYVRLWNYAAGTPEDAAIELPFQALESGFLLPGEAVHAADIDRMFISLVPPGYAPGSTDALPARADGWVELSDIACDGARAVLAIGDVLVPPHGTGLATAYDDAFDQTPARLLRMAECLGYRGALVHYVGMSHFFRLGADGLALADGTLCAPAEAWHRSFFAEAARMGFEPIASLSFELLAQHCPEAWQQRASDGTPARTGWVPPSALLSPASEPAMAWLRAVATRFVGLMVDAVAHVRFQIGEPWWWILPDGRPCLYDDAAKAAFGGNPPVIADMRANLNKPKQDLLDAAGALLAAATRGIADAVRAAWSGGAEVMLLVFTPTVLDPAMPDARRANLPGGWAFPAYDRLQVEDYDWLTGGAEALRRAGYAKLDERLGYPLERQDYIAGFVLDPADAEPFWARIDAGLDEAAARGVPRTFVWAAPQVARDGYVRLPSSEENEVQSFDDVLYPLALGRDAGVSPEFLTSVAVTASGHERRNSLWSDARLRFDVGPGIRSEAELGVLIAFFRARRGAARGFRLSDPFDHSSNGMTGVPGPLDQPIGTGDGLISTFQLAKLYGEGDEPQVRPITRPRAETVRVSVGGVETTDFTLDPGGRVVLGSAPAAGVEVRAGFLFDVPVRFAEDRLDVTGAAFAAGEAPSVPLIEVRETPA
ncbi:hypothetical protein A6F68_00272 [Tsuneonella dongtanensis]|uniref:TIGR02217 family protein n=1 Tax=Tsuneonella dongtanensis TaxID=692370 RepID=A0A1B2A9G4_9SPHN|nr:DUF2460 domain-containing protein [Tsuneonella dongtanensis]ANY18807.1 hypothetical protein A6F68_00272 [Tsuneonella dongtanensis]